MAIQALKKHYQAILVIVLGLAVLLLHFFHLLPARYLIFAAAGIETLVLVMVVFNLSKIIRRFRTLRRDGQPAMTALQRSLEVVFSPRVARLVTIEPKLYYALIRSFRKPNQNGDAVFRSRLDTYGFFIKAILFVALLESAVVQFALSEKWWKLKLAHLILMIWAFIFIFAMYRAMQVFAHEPLPSGLRLQMGLNCQGWINWDQIASVRPCSKVVPTFGTGPVIPKDEPGVLYLSAGENCNVVMDLKTPQIFDGMIRNFTGVKKIFFSLEQPDKFIASVSTHITSPLAETLRL